MSGSILDVVEKLIRNTQKLNTQKKGEDLGSHLGVTGMQIVITVMYFLEKIEHDMKKETKIKP